MNRFLKRGLLSLVAGIALNVAGYLMMEHNQRHYGWLMIAGVILFGLGFILILYSFMRKVEAQGLIEERAEVKEKRKRFRLELKKPKKVSPAS
ncbi:hypothetical protein [Desertivirga arenae]|uniref:hypothetical protein n=1 Tax=Desertivirga arenae TaxID=2810309 RepID=UPI001A95E143|nr:hypothetical protein [Pedobacter sp. SYSU D00823]